MRGHLDTPTKIYKYDTMKLFTAVLWLAMLWVQMPLYGQTNTPNPAAEGFNLLGSDARAVSLADEVMEAQGGRQAWDETRYLGWTFFGRRKLLWDKWTGDVRIEVIGQPTVYLVNVNTRTGRVQKDGLELTQPDSLAKYVEQGIRIWINDSYWLCMPYKLKDSGLTLRYLGDTLLTAAGQEAHWLELTFAGVGVTPDNKYHVAVDKTSRLVTEWRFFTRYDDPSPRFSTPWADYQLYGRILLSGNRGEWQLSDISAPERVDPRVFVDF